MPARNLLPQIGVDVLRCMGLGFTVWLVRLVFSYRRGRMGACADAFGVGIGLLALQSYAAGISRAGVLRWYMLAGAIAGAWAVERLLGPWRRRIGQQLEKHFQKWRKKAAERTKRTGNTEKRTEKQLPKPARLLYNSNI